MHNQSSFYFQGKWQQKDQVSMYHAAKALVKAIRKELGFDFIDIDD